MTLRTVHTLEGLEPDNLLSMLCVLGLLQSVEAVDTVTDEDARLRPRIAWTGAPLRPCLYLAHSISERELSEVVDEGINMLAVKHQFGDHKDLDHSPDEARELLRLVAMESNLDDRYAADLLAALMCDAAVKEGKDSKAAVIDPTPMCLLFGGGHQHFLERLASVPQQKSPLQRGTGKTALFVSPAESIYEALYEPWHRSDRTFSFRWDAEEAVRYALMAGDPTDDAYKAFTQHGANRLAAVGISTLTVSPRTRGTRVRLGVIAGALEHGVFSFAWPIWRDPASLRAIRGLLGHPGLRQKDGLRHLGVDHVIVARRITIGKLMNFTRGTRLETAPPVQTRGVSIR